MDLNNLQKIDAFKQIQVIVALFILEYRQEIEGKAY